MFVRQHCAEIDESARRRIEPGAPETAGRNGAAEKLKADNMGTADNACKAQTEEIVKFELVYD